MEDTATDFAHNSVLQSDLLQKFKNVRARTEFICSFLDIEDYVVQPIEDVSPPKWHLAHSTWFFETFFLPSAIDDYRPFNEDFNFLFNSYYESVGKRVLRADRGNITRPGVDVIYKYRKHVDKQMAYALSKLSIHPEIIEILNLGLEHEMQHQELLLSDIKYILGHNPLFPIYNADLKIDEIAISEKSNYISFDAGIYEIGFKDKGFSFDNERNRHKVYLEHFTISSQPVTFGEYLEFIESGGYSDFKYWHSDGWAWVKENKITAPMFVYAHNRNWYRYTMSGYKQINHDEILMHINFYEASAFAFWKGARLPTEFEWEAAADKFEWGSCWEWTNSAYLPYPGFKAAPGAIGEYNGKFMINQMVLRGCSQATAPSHSRKSYRNFFQPHLQWQFAGLRLAR